MKIMLLFLNIRGQKIKNTHGMKIANIYCKSFILLWKGKMFYGRNYCTISTGRKQRKN